MFSSVSDNIIGIDISEEALRTARSRYNTPTFLKADAIELPFQNECFDAVVALEVIEHVHNQEKFILEILRTLKEEGLLIFSTPNKKNLVARIASAFGIEVQKNPYHTREFDYKELIKFLKKFGLEIIKVLGIYLPLVLPINRYIIELIHSFRIDKLVIYLGYSVPSLSRFTFVVCKKFVQG